ncbi:hypothetical protein FIBSPDRAFT_894752 [Athelia psychrophila]|uniref:RNase III domain-containing protein n=1 Tax=Athelia psychrophila TaxID=1759441 RepID=A0A166FH60_9AGAM|nr:hypothetical protein FIBSPDRAFT_894752 [Fibularhizoctonia sp. CBS 109695]
MSDRFPHDTHVVETIVAAIHHPSFLFSLPPVSAGEWEQVLGAPPAPKPRNVIFRRAIANKDVIEFAGDGIMFMMYVIALSQVIPEDCDYDAETLCRALVTNKVFFHLVLKDGKFLANHGSRERVTKMGYSKLNTKWVSDHFEVQIGVYHQVNGYDALLEWILRALRPLIFAGQRASTELYDLPFSSWFLLIFTASDSLQGFITPGHWKQVPRAPSQDLPNPGAMKKVKMMHATADKGEPSGFASDQFTGPQCSGHQLVAATSPVPILGSSSVVSALNLSRQSAAPARHRGDDAASVLCTPPGNSPRRSETRTSPLSKDTASQQHDSDGVTKELGSRDNPIVLD